jgi:hypothetical protein
MVMSKFEISSIRGLFFMRDINNHVKHYYPCGLNLRDKLWWWLMPGVIINVTWPRETMIVVGFGHRKWSGMGPMYEEVYSTDPNDHYRPWLEKYVGKQGWDWDWGMANNDVAENRLTIKIRRKYAKYATIAMMQWS